MKLISALLVGYTAFAAGPILLDPGAMQLHHVKVEKVSLYKRNTGVVRVTDMAGPDAADGAMFAVIPGIEFEDGVIEVDVAGDLVPNPFPGARGFVGLAFRVQQDAAKYECFYLRPLNGRSNDQEMRNHSVQYMSNPEFGWQRLRTEAPGKYETYTDLERGEWAHMKMEIKGDKARLYVNRATQPTLIVNDLKHGVSKGTLALWIGPGTVGYFSNLRINPGHGQ